MLQKKLIYFFSKEYTIDFNYTRIHQIKILLIRTSSIGDIIFSLPFVCSIKKSFPQAEITWFVEKKYSSILKNDNCIDHIICWPREDWSNLFKTKKILLLITSIIRFIKLLRNIEYDLVIDLQGLLRTNIFTRLANSKKRISLGSEFCGFLFCNEIFPRDHKSKRISSEYLALAKHMKFKYEEFEPRFILPKDNEKLVYDKFSFLNKISSNFFTINPFTTRNKKHWSNLHWNELVELLIKKYQIKCIVLGGELNTYQEKLIEILEDKVINLTGQTSLIEAAGIINLSRFVVGVDTGLTHMSISLNKATIALFGNTCPYLDPINQNSKVMWVNKSCSPCKLLPENNEVYTCLNGIHPELIIKEIEKIDKSKH